MEIVSKNPTTAIWNKMWIVKISTVNGRNKGKNFLAWLDGKSFPVVKEDEFPNDWAWCADYSVYVNTKKPRKQKPRKEKEG